jgi:hypothetical protein
VLNSYPEGDPVELVNNLTEEDKEKIEKDESLVTFKLDNFDMPSLLIKVIKSLKKYDVCEFITNKIDKLRTNFANPQMDQYKLFNEGDQVKFLISLLYVSKDQYFYQFKVAEKLARV